MAQSTNDNTSAEAQQFSCLYFGFASNLSPRTIKQRCPSALYAGLAVLKGWKFVVSEVGFGNIVPGTEDDIVYGGINFLSRRDEEALDKSEEAGTWHEKMKLKVTRVLDPAAPMAGPEVEVMTYVDMKRVGEGVISKEYITWLRKAVADGLQAGVPQGYFEKYVNRFLPEDGSVGREENVMMIRTLQMDKNDTGYVPSHVLKSSGEGRG